MEGVPIVAQQVMNSSIHEEVCLISGLTSGLRIWHCHEQWHRSQRRLRSHVAIAVVQAGTCSSELIDPLAWELPCAAGACIQYFRGKLSDNTISSTHIVNDKGFYTEKTTYICKIFM